MIKDVSIEIIQKCLNNCLHCSSCSTSKSTAILSKNDVAKVVDGLCTLGVQRICLSGGEPFLHPDVSEIIGYISQKGIIIDVYSCGILGNEDAPTALSLTYLKKLKSVGLKSIIFNMPSASEKTYDFITKTTGHFSLLIESVSIDTPKIRVKKFSASSIRYILESSSVIFSLYTTVFRFAISNPCLIASFLK